MAFFIWKRLGKTEKTFAVLLSIIIAISFAGRLWNMFVMKNNLPFFHLYILIEALLLIHIFIQLYESHWRKLKWLVLAGSFLIAWMLNITAISSMWIYPDYMLGLESVLILSLVLGWFRKMLREKKIRKPSRTFAFWMSSGLLIYFSGNFLLFVFSNFINDQEHSVFVAVWMVNTILVILLYLMYTTGFLCIPKTKK